MGCGASTNEQRAGEKSDAPTAKPPNAKGPSLPASPKKLRLNASALDTVSKKEDEVETEQRRSLYEQISSRGERRESALDGGDPMNRSVKGLARPVDCAEGDAMNRSVKGLFRPTASFVLDTDSPGAALASEDDGSTSAYSFSEAEVDLSQEDFDGLLSKKMMRPHSAKGFSVPEPTTVAMEEKMRAVIMRGILHSIDAAVEPSRMLRIPRWANALSVKSVLRAIGEGNAANGIVPIVSSEDDYLDDILSILGVDPDEMAALATDGTCGVATDHPEAKQEADVLSSIASGGSVGATCPVQLGSLRLGTFDGSESSSAFPGTGIPELRVGKYYFRNARALRAYAVTLKPWVLEQLLGVSDFDAALNPSWSSEGPSANIAMGEASITLGGLSSTSHGSLPKKDFIGAKSIRDEEVLRMMMQ